MPKLTFHPFLNGIRGSVGDLVVRQTPQGPVIQRRPDMSQVVWSPAQIAHRERMKGAALHYRRVMADPRGAASYRARAKKAGIPVSSLVMGEYLGTGTRE